jgi:hypothetical protein
MATEPSKIKIRGQYPFFKRLQAAAKVTGTWFPTVYDGPEQNKHMTEFPLNQERLDGLVAACNAKISALEAEIFEVEQDRDSVLTQAAEQGYFVKETQ